jgi:hypothetical protein
MSANARLAKFVIAVGGYHVHQLGLVAVANWAILVLLELCGCFCTKDGRYNFCHFSLAAKVSESGLFSLRLDSLRVYARILTLSFYNCSLNFLHCVSNYAISLSIISCTRKTIIKTTYD